MAFLLAACGQGTGTESPDAPGAATGQRLSDPWTCDPAEWCHVSVHTIDCPPGAPETVAYAWPTQAGLYCTQRFACGPAHPLCPEPIEP